MGREIVQVPTRRWGLGLGMGQIPATQPSYQWPKNEIETQRTQNIQVPKKKKKANHRNLNVSAHTNTRTHAHIVMYLGLPIIQG